MPHDVFLSHGWPHHGSVSAPRPRPRPREIHDVWDSNFDEEFHALLVAVSRAGGPKAALALDMEFPGFIFANSRNASQEIRYQALRQNIDQMWPIQLGVAVVGSNGVHCGVWTFNLHFDVDVDAHTEKSMDFLRNVGIDFPRHRKEGIAVSILGQRLANSCLVGAHGRAPCWITFSGSYDWGYLLKLVTSGRALPSCASTFDNVLSIYFPKRHDLQDFLPNGSLEELGRKYGVKRWGSAHTAGSDALLTLDLFLWVGGLKLEAHAPWKLGEMQEWEQWSWNNTGEWYIGSSDPFFAGDMSSFDEEGAQPTPVTWESSDWASQSQLNNDWFPAGLAPVTSQAWYPSRFQTGAAAL